MPQLQQRFQKVAFSRIYRYQCYPLQSKLFFTLIMLLRFFFKDAFLMFFFIFKLPLAATTIKQLVLVYAVQFQVPIVVSLMVLFLLMSAALSRKIKLLRNLNYLVIPVVDGLHLPAVFALMIISSATSTVIMSIACTLLIVLLCTLVTSWNIVNFSKYPKSSYLFIIRQAIFNTISQTLLIFFAYYIMATWLSRGRNEGFSSQEQIIYALIHVMLTICKFKQRLLLVYFVNPYSQAVGSALYLAQFNLSILTIAQKITQLDSIFINLPYLLVVMTTLAYLSLDRYLSSRQFQLYNTEAREIKREDQAILYLDCLADLARKVENQEEDIMLISLKFKHTMNCVCPKCYCRKSQNQSLNTFIKCYINSQLQKLSQSFTSTPNILISILYFKMIMFHSYSDILCKLSEYSQKFTLNLLQRFYLYCLTQYMEKYIAGRNREISAVQSQHMFWLEALKEEMETICKNQGEVREKGWKYLARALCRIEELQNLCDSQLGYIKRMMNIYYQNKVKYKKSKQFNLLLMFYFLKVALLNHGSDLRTNLKQIYYGFKVDQLRSFKQFKKFIYHKSSCAIQTLVDTKIMGVITSASRNVEDLFGITADKVKGMNINDLMPDFLREEHDRLMADWVQNGTWRTIGKLKQIYCVHKEGHCFSALMYLKLYVRQGQLYFITNVFKINDSDYLVLTPEHKIKGIGRKFVKVLGDNAINVPLEAIIEHRQDSPPKLYFQEERTYRRVFMGLKDRHGQIGKYVQQQGKEEVKQSMHSLDVIQPQKSVTTFYRNLRQHCAQKYFIQFTVQNYRMGNIIFPVLKASQVYPIERQQTQYFLSKSFTAINSVRQHLGEEVNVDIESIRRSQVSRDERGEEVQFEAMATSSMASTSEKQNYPLSRMVQRFIQLLLHPQRVSDRRIVCYTFVLVLVIVLLLAINFISAYIYRQLLLQIQSIFFADGAVSDIMQTTQIAYAHVYQLRSQLLTGQHLEFQSQLSSARYVLSFVYGLNQFSFRHLISDTSQFKHKRLYQYIEEPAIWMQNNQTIEIGTIQFLIHLYYLTQEMVNQLQYLKATNQTDIKLLNLQKIQLNFQQMKDKNQFFLDDYSAQADKSISTLNTISIASLCFYALLSLILFASANQYFKFRFYQKETSFNFIALIPNHMIQKMKQFYVQLNQKVFDKKLLPKIDQNQEQLFAIQTHEIGKSDQSKMSTFSKIKIINYGSYYKWLLFLVLFVAVNSVNYLTTANVRDIFEPSSRVIQLIGKLMQGQNRLLQAYFDLKAEYYLNANHNSSQMAPKLFDQVRQHIDKAGEQWNYYANQVSLLLLSYNPSYQSKFQSALADNICILTAEVLPQSQVQKCNQQFQINMLDGGIMLSMNYFRKTVIKALEQLKRQHNDNNSDYFLQLHFTELDKMQIYMFKIYQLTQSICYDAFIDIIGQLMQQFTIWVIVLAIGYISFMTFWLVIMSNEKQQISKLHARLVLVPFGILKNNPRIVNSFKQGVQYNQ